MGSSGTSRPPSKQTGAITRLQAPPGHEPADLASVYEIGLEPILPDFLARSDGRTIGYRGQLHWVQGEPESGKSWLAILACVQAIAEGGRATYVDYETSVARFLLRLRALGIPDADVVERLTYVSPEGSVREHGEHYAHLFAGREVVAIDACTAAMTAEGLNPDKALDVAAWKSRLPDWAIGEGAAVLVVDHVVKSREDRGRWATGSGHKLAATDVAFSLDAIRHEPFGVGLRGRAWVHVQKDRDGGIRSLEDEHGAVADLVLDATGTPATLALEAPSAKPVKESTADRIYALVPDPPETIGLDEIAETVGASPKTCKNTLAGPRLRNLVQNVAPKNRASAWQRYE